MVDYLGDIMSKGLLFWILMILWLLFGLGAVWSSSPYVVYLRGGFTLLEFTLFALLGWSEFGPAVK